MQGVVDLLRECDYVADVRVVQPAPRVGALELFDEPPFADKPASRWIGLAEWT